MPLPCAGANPKLAADHLQLGEVLERLGHDAACSIVDPREEHVREVAVRLNERRRWTVEARVNDKPPTDVLALLSADRFDVARVEDQVRLGPNRGKHFAYFLIHRAFDDVEAAARAGLALFARLWPPPAGEWLWITAENYADRGEPDPPGGR